MADATGVALGAGAVDGAAGGVAGAAAGTSVFSATGTSAGRAAVSSILATISPMRKLSPSLANCCKVPACSAFTSKVAFSLSSSAITWSLSTQAPSGWVHFSKVTSLIDSPIEGIFISIIQLVFSLLIKH